MTYPPPRTRRLIMLFAMVGAVMNQVDTTIANVALPHMQGSTSASREQITWVLTSYIVASAICTPLTGWLASRFGRKRLMLVSILGFTFVSGLCGIAANLGQLIAFRLLQGMFGSALVPMSQATMLDITPPEEHGKAMALFGLAAILGPLAGPLLGGYLTSAFSWHWVFLINLPLGLIAFLGLSANMQEVRSAHPMRFDGLGFALLAIGVGAFQLMLDRGQMLDWFESREIWVEAIVAGTAAYLMLVHVSTTAHPFVSPAVFRDRNFVISTGLGFILGIMIYSVLSLLPPMMAELMGYPIMSIGMAMAPRGIGTMIATLFAGWMVGKIDGRLMVFAGLMIGSMSSWVLSNMTLEADATPIIVSGVLNGMGSSLIFVPLAAMSFATLNPRYRNEGAAVGTLIRNLGGSIGIAVVQAVTIRNEATVQSRLIEGVRPDNPAINAGMPDLDFSSIPALSGIDHEVVRQALMVSYVDVFWALFVIGAFSAPLVFLLRKPAAAKQG
ncbi:MAG: DHA2 family efflux MFS transporter permease subunit [Sphingomonadales bacterium]|nr:DHA2 family efflux MFS transporter permease subunit [Sphingomonadales bacterium]